MPQNTLSSTPKNLIGTSYPTVRIHNIECVDQGDSQLLSGRVDELTLWFRLPASLEIDPADASPFVTAAFIPAMLLGEALSVDDEYRVSTGLAASLPRLHDIYSAWNPLFKPVRLEARLAQSQAANPGGGCFFSGGVDGTYSLLKNLDTVRYALLINGFDFNMDDEAWGAMVARNRQFCQAMDRELVAIETNFKSFTSAFGLARAANYGSVLAAIAQVLRLETVYISTGDSYRWVVPEGSHVLTDPLWSTEVTTIVHDGLEANRSKKIAFIRNYPLAMENLWVCWESPDYNCGRCSKCIRTWIALTLNGIEDFHFVNEVSIKDLKSLSVTDEDDRIFFEAFMEEARDKELLTIYKILRNRILMFEFRTLVRKTLALCFPRLDRWLLARRPAADRQVEIGFLPRYSDSLVLARVRAHRAAGELHQEVPRIGSVYEGG